MLPPLLASHGQMWEAMDVSDRRKKLLRRCESFEGRELTAFLLGVILLTIGIGWFLWTTTHLVLLVVAAVIATPIVSLILMTKLLPGIAKVDVRDHR